MNDISEEVEAVLGKAYNVEPTVHIDPIQPENPMVQKVDSFLDVNWSKDERITDWHDLRVIETEKHNVILFGVNTSASLNQSGTIACCREIEDSLANEFPNYEIEIKISPLYRF